MLSAALLLVIASAANAAGLGKLVVLSAMGEPFRAEIDLLSYPGDRGAPALRLASPEAYAQAGFRYNPALAGTRFNIRSPSSGRQIIDVASPRPLNEPFVYLLIEVESNATRIMRGYTALLDPPGYRAPQAAAVEYRPASIPVVAAPVVKPAAQRARTANQTKAVARPAPRQDRLSDADAKTLAAMLERVAALEIAVAQLQRQWEKPAVAAVPVAPAAQAPAIAAPVAPATPVTQPVREPATAPVEATPRRNSTQDSLLNNALLVLAIGLLMIVAWLAWVVWGPPSKEAKPQVKG